MIPFRPEPDWYKKTWYSPEPPRHPRPLFAPALVGIVCVLLAVAGITIVDQPEPIRATIHFG